MENSSAALAQGISGMEWGREIKKNTEMKINGAVGNLNGVKPNERAVKCSEVQ
jgi:hypothetical protein